MTQTVNPLTATPDELNDYLASRHALSPEARKSMIVALRSFLTWAYRRGLIATDLSAELPSVTIPRGLPRPISAAALGLARAQADEETRLMLDLGARAGLRRGEIAAVHSSDITELGLRVRGKGDVVRLVPVHPLLQDRLAAIHGWVFPSPRRSGNHVGGDYVSSRLERVLPEPYTAHSLRHYFATEAYRGSHNIRAVQQLLGHADISTTMRYVMVEMEALTTAVHSVA